jgi:flagellar hook-associated protein 2
LGLAFGSINTGLPKDIVQQIMKAERLPITNMETRKGKFADKKALVTELTGLVEGIRGTLATASNARSLRELTIDTNESIIGINADKNIAEPGSYQFEVKQLAQKSSAMTSGFADPDESYVGVGFIQYTLPDGTNKEIYVDSDNSSLNKIAKLINRDSENGLKANVVNDGSESDEAWRLILSLEETGDANKAEFPYFYFVDGVDDLYIEFEREAQDAVVAMDGFEIQLPANSTSDLIPGVSIDLKKAAPGEEFSINISEDTAAISGKIKTVFDQINSVLKFVKDQNTMDENTDTSRTLGGDIMLSTLEGRIRSMIFKPIQTSVGNFRVGDLGVSFTRQGDLQFDEEKFRMEIEKNYDRSVEILTGAFMEGGVKTNGFIDNVNELIDTTLRFPDGLLASRKRSLENNMAQVDRRIKQRERMLEQKEKNLKDKFARLEGTISKIRAQGAGVQGLGGGAPAIQQLG